MNKTIGARARIELIRAIGARYRASSKPERIRILDEFVAVTGYHRKHSIRLFNPAAEPTGGSPRVPRLRLYDQAVREALVVLWEASDRVCGKRLKPLLPLLVTALERHRHITLDVAVRQKLMAASASTIDRLLAEPRSTVSTRQVERSRSNGQLISEFLSRGCSLLLVRQWADVAKC